MPSKFKDLGKALGLAIALAGCEPKQQPLPKTLDYTGVVEGVAVAPAHNRLLLGTWRYGHSRYEYKYPITVVVPLDEFEDKYKANDSTFTLESLMGDTIDFELQTGFRYGGKYRNENSTRIYFDPYPTGRIVNIKRGRM